MKLFKFILLIIISLFPIHHALAGSISLDHLDGTWDDGGTTKIIAGAPVSFYIRLTNDNGTDASGITNGFRIYGPNSFDPIVGEVILPGFEDYFDLVFTINNFSIDGSGADTVGFGGSKLTGSGLVDGFDDVPYKITTGNIPEGETLCLDSSYYPPTGSWIWAPGGAPSWDGPHCFVSEVLPCLPPIVDNAPTSLNGSHCDVITFDFNATSSEPYTWSVNIGTIDANGVWSYAPSLADVGQSMVLTVTATSFCSGTADINLNFTNEAPIIDCPSDLNVSIGIETSFQLTATDDCDPISWGIINDDGINATIDPNSGLLTVNPPVAGYFTVTVEASDGIVSSSCDIAINGIPGSLFQVEIACVGDQNGNFVFQGQHIDVPISLNTGNTIEGFDFLIAYDNSALSFQAAIKGADLVDDRWEYFNYRFGANGNCGNACPNGLLRVVAFAETNNGPIHPVLDGVVDLFNLDFLVTNDRTFECQSVPIRFFWMDCGDNAVSSDGGNSMHVTEKIYDGDAVLFPPNGMEIQDFFYGFPTYFGTQDDCIVLTADKPAPIRDLTFNNGCVWIACADAIDARGDINLNNVANEIADAVLLSNYFVYGLSVFTINTEGQIAATDVNADGLSLSVADLVYLIRVIIGDALPYAKLAPLEATITMSDHKYSVDTEIGAALLILDGNSSVELLADEMVIKTEYNFESNMTRVLIYSLNGESFSGDFIKTDADLISIELGSSEGAVVNSKIIPGNYELMQNYPNPFNPTTTISFSIPFAEQVSLVIYNINGQRIAEFKSAYEAGTHQIEWDASSVASGIYFYKLQAGEFNFTKKMVLLK